MGSFNAILKGHCNGIARRQIESSQGPHVGLDIQVLNAYRRSFIGSGGPIAEEAERFDDPEHSVKN